MPFQAPRRTAPEEETEERGDEMALLMWTLAATRASLEPTLLVSSKSEGGMRILAVLADLSWEDAEEHGVVGCLATVTDSAEEVCAERDEEEPDETCAAVASGRNVDGPGARVGGDEHEGSGEVGAEGSMEEKCASTSRHYLA